MVKVLCDKCQAEVELTAKKIKEICTRQYKEKGAVLPPEYCFKCEGCVLGTIVKLIAQQQ